MKKLSPMQTALSFAGFFLGAGYVSGQELWQFFGSFGYMGLFGLILALSLLLFTGIITVKLNRATGLEAVDELIIKQDIPALRFAVSALEFLFLFGVAAIMFAGVGALLNTLFGLPAFIGSAVFAAAVTLISFSGFSGMVSAFGFTVPVLCCFTAFFGISSVIENGIVFPAAEAQNSLLSSWFVAAISFACYNVFGSIALIAPLGKRIKGSGGLFLGALFLLLIALSVLVTVSAKSEYAHESLPMLSYSLDKNRWLGLLYALLLLLAMFGTALSSLVGYVNMAKLKSAKINANERLFTAVSAFFAFLGSLFGFGELIGTIYPMFGYLSSIFIIMMLVHYFSLRRKV